MDIKKDFENDSLTIIITGRIDTYTAPELNTAITEELNNFKSLTLDFKEVEYISSAGLRVLISTQKKSKKENFDFKIKNISEVVGEILRMSKFDKILNIE